MPDARRHRGPHPRDRTLFADRALPALRAAHHDLCWLLDRGYADASALKLVGDRHGLNRRQRVAVRRCACTGAEQTARAARRVEAVAGRTVHIDGFNLLTTVEAALAGGVLLRGRDRCVRDMASMHGSYRGVEETEPAIARVGAALATLGVREVVWHLDRPVSNSGRLAARLRAAAETAGWPWRVQLDDDPDPVLVALEGPVVVSADSGVLDRCGPWFDLAAHVVRGLPEAWLVDVCPR